MGMAAYPCAGGGGAGAAFRLALHGDGGGLAMVSLLHGDCLELLPSVADGSVSMVFADLPYGVTHNRWDGLIPFEPLWTQLLRVGTQRAAFIFTGTQPFATDIISSCRPLFRYEVFWPKKQGTSPANANCRPMAAHEGVYVFSRATCNPRSKLRMTYNPQKTAGKPYKARQKEYCGTNYGTGLGKWMSSPSGDRHPTTVLPVFPMERGLHPTQKPVALLEWLVKTYSNPGDTVLDPTAGSGTTGVACLNTGRSFIGMEKDATYFATAQRRIAEAQPPLPGAA